VAIAGVGSVDPSLLVVVLVVLCLNIARRERGGLGVPEGKVRDRDPLLSADASGNEWRKATS